MSGQGERKTRRSDESENESHNEQGREENARRDAKRSRPSFKVNPFLVNLVLFLLAGSADMNVRISPN